MPKLSTQKKSYTPHSLLAKVLSHFWWVDSMLIGIPVVLASAAIWQYFFFTFKDTSYRLVATFLALIFLSNTLSRLTIRLSKQYEKKA